MADDTETDLRTRLLAQIAIFEKDRNRLSGKKVARLLREEVLRQGLPPSLQELAYAAGILHASSADSESNQVTDEGMQRVLSLLFENGLGSNQPPQPEPPTPDECRKAAAVLKSASERPNVSFSEALQRVAQWLEEKR